MTDFSLRTLCSMTLLNSHSNSSRTPTDSFRLSIWPITHSVNSDGFISFLTLLHYPVECNRKGDSKHLISSRIREAKPTAAKFIPPNSRKGFFNQIILTMIKKWIIMWRAGKRKSQESTGAKKWRSTVLMPISRQTWKVKECSQGLYLGNKELGCIKPRHSALLTPQTGHRAPGRRKGPQKVWKRKGDKRDQES